MSGGLRPPTLKCIFQNPFPVTENDIVHCVLILQGLLPALPLTGGSDPVGYVRAVYVLQSVFLTIA